ncbi:pseudouridine synthase [Sporodiniella umbellata]|nr:pseudouridine synthase [Sporodiniella umbellata]
MGNFLSRSTDDQTQGTKRSLDYEETGDSKRFCLDQHVVINEEAAGIAAFVNPTLQGFHSILKYRGEDFLVNEVDMDRNIIRVTSLEGPNTRTKGHELEVLEVGEFDRRMTEVMGKDFATEFRHFLNKPKDDSSLFVEADKEQRVKFYRLIENNMEEKLHTRAKDGKITIKWPTATEFHNEFVDFDALGGDYLQVHMNKSGVDTMNAINIIASKSGIPAKFFGYAGTKDARAITTQVLSLKKIKPGRLLAAKDDLMKSGIYIGNYTFVKDGLTLGDLGGNHFTIVLRDVKNISEAGLQASLESLRDNGFLNYFGMQRFGTSSVMTHTVGREIMKRKYEQASNLILYPRDGDGEAFGEARKLWKDTKDAEATLAIMPKRAFAERKLLSSYARRPENHECAIKSLPKNMLSLYPHAYQSYVWNRVVSERSKLYGCEKPLVGDIVLVEKKKNASKPEKSTKRANDHSGRRDFSDRKVPKVLTEQDVNDYTIDDVVYPLPGTQSVYPENEMKSIYERVLAEDGISMQAKDKHFEGLKGDYRSILVKPEQMNWSFIRYNDPIEKLCNTDVDRLHDLPEPTGVQNGQFLALKVEFTLGTSQYATMALREIMRAETSSQAQSTLSHN